MPPPKDVDASAVSAVNETAVNRLQWQAVDGYPAFITTAVQPYRFPMPQSAFSLPAVLDRQGTAEVEHASYDRVAST
jgi:hypothetical protein